MSNVNKLYRILRGVLTKWKYSLYKRDKYVWVFGEWFGERCGDNCTYLANYVARNYPEINVCWVAENGTDTAMLADSISVIERGTTSAKRILRRAGVGFVGQNFKDYDESGFNYLGNAATVLLWHGIPWKRIGHDSSCEESNWYQIYVKLFDYTYGTRYILSPSMAFDSIATSAFGIKCKNIIKAGYPRNSVFYDSEEVKRRREVVFNAIGWKDFQTKIIVYMPTFRDTSKKYDIGALANNSELVEYMNENNVIVIQKAHFVSAARGENGVTIDNPRFFNLNDIDAQSLLCAADLLVTDYSGCFFDYSLLDRPIVHFIYDYDDYRSNDRGLYYEKEEVMFGTAATTEAQLLNSIIENIEHPALEHQRREEMKSRYLSYESPCACKTITDSIIALLKGTKN